MNRKRIPLAALISGAILMGCERTDLPLEKEDPIKEKEEPAGSECLGCGTEWDLSDSIPPSGSSGHIPPKQGSKQVNPQGIEHDDNQHL